MNRFYRNIDVEQGDDTYNQGKTEDFIPGEYGLNTTDDGQSSQINQKSANTQNTQNIKNNQNIPNSAINTPLYPTVEQNAGFDEFAGFNERLTKSINPLESTEQQSYASPYTGIGSLIVRVFTADQALPLENVKVTVTSDEGALSDMHEIRYTDSSGRTEPINLPAPNVELSRKPQVTLRPYAVYNVLCEADGYTRNCPVNAVVFDNVQSLQNVPLIAKRENESQNQNE